MICTANSRERGLRCKGNLKKLEIHTFGNDTTGTYIFKTLTLLLHLISNRYAIGCVESSENLSRLEQRRDHPITLSRLIPSNHNPRTTKAYKLYPSDDGSVPET